MKESTIKIVRNRHNTYCIYDYVYKDGKLLGEQSNLTSKNKFGAKQYKFNGKTLNVNAWEWGEKR